MARATQPERLDTRSSVLVATEQLLGEVALHDVSVAMIMSRAGVSRRTFYSYFESKFEVVATLLEDVMNEMFAILGAVRQGQTGSSREELWRSLIAESIRLRVRHRAIFNAAHENWHAVPEIRGQWLRAVERFTDAIGAELDRDVEAGPAARNRQRAAAVLWATDHLLYVAGVDADDDLPDEDAVLETLLVMWMGTLYGAAVTASASKGARSGRTRSHRPR